MKDELCKKNRDTPGSSACRKGYDSRKVTVLHAEQTARNRDEFCFLASGSRTKVLPPSKKQKAQMPLKPRV